MIDASHQQRLWQANLKVAANLVRDYCYNPVLTEDALQETKLALWEATLNWREDMQATFSQYAWLYMRRKLFTYLTETASDRPRLSRLERQIINDIRKHIRAGELISCQLLDAISLETGITRFRLTQLVSYWYHGCITITAYTFEMVDELVASDLIPETDTTRLDEGIQALPEREKLIIISRYLQHPKATLAELAKALGISTERVWQLESSAMKKLRKHLADA